MQQLLTFAQITQEKNALKSALQGYDYDYLAVHAMLPSRGAKEGLRSVYSRYSEVGA